MIDWFIVALAFAAGLLLVILLETGAKSGYAGWRWSGLAVVLVLLSLLGWLLLGSPADEEMSVVERSEMVVLATVTSDPAVSPLPPPSIFTQGAAETVTPSAAPTVPPLQPATLAIPDLGVRQPIVDVPLQDGAWDVSRLGENVGLLAGGGRRPGDELAMVLAGHMTYPSSRQLLQGAFADLQYAVYGTDVILQIDREELRYEVVQIERVDPNDVERLRVPDGDSILLVTCTDWDENGHFYAKRLLIRAERVDKGV